MSERKHVAALDFDASTIGAHPGECPLRYASVAVKEVSCVTPLRIGICRPGAPCRSEGFCANTGIYIVDPAGSRVVTQAENFCAKGDVACRLTGLTVLPDGGYCYGTHNIVMNLEQKSDMIACSSGGARYEHYMRVMGGYVTGLTYGPDGKVWYAESEFNGIGRLAVMDVTSSSTSYSTSKTQLGLGVLAPGPGNTVWFTALHANKIGRITTFGSITEYDIPTANAQPAGIIAGPNDGKMWFTEFNVDKVASLTMPLPQVVEFYNANLDNYFIHANAAEQAAIDSGSAGPGWIHTGNSFASGGPIAVCRFYGSIAPGPNSHFYTSDANECAQLKQIQATTPATQKRWNFESNDFQTTPTTNASCPPGLVPVYRAYNNGFSRGIDSNDRITSSAAGIAAVVSKGWSSEGVVMCAPSQ